MINTRKVRDRRGVRFENFDQAIRDAEALAAAERAGALRRLGNWTSDNRQDDIAIQFHCFESTGFIAAQATSRFFSGVQ